MSAYEQYRRELAAAPPFTADPIARLRHTLAIYRDERRDARLVTATTYGGPEGREWTGLTVGDLRAILDQHGRMALELDARNSAIERARTALNGDATR